MYSTWGRALVKLGVGRKRKWPLRAAPPATASAERPSLTGRFPLCPRSGRWRLPHCGQLEIDVRPSERHPVVDVAGEQVHGGQALRGQFAALVLANDVNVDQRIAVLDVLAADGARNPGGVASHV